MIFWLVSRTLRNRFVPNLLTLLAVALGVGVALAVPLTLLSLREGAVRASSIFNLLVTAKGSPTQAVLNTIFYQESPVGNIPFALYQKLKTDLRTKSAIPMGFGDNYNNFPMVGTNPEFFELREKRSDPAFYQTVQGRLFNKPFEAAVGAQAAKVSGLKLGDTFKPAHGTVALIEADEHEEDYTVVGILAATGGPGDRGIYVDIESIWDVHGQDEHHEKNEHTAGEVGHANEGTVDTREVTAVLYTPTRLGYVYQIASELDQGKYLTGVASQGIFPGQTVGRLLDLLGQGREGYAIIGTLVLILALATVAVNTYASALAGQRNLAILRAVGARASTVIAVVLLEALLITSLGVLLGVGLAYFGTWVVGLILEQNVGLSLPLLFLEPTEYFRVLLLLPVAVIFAIVPALSATRFSPLERLNR
jgi:putative ABC transport system permease protein